MLYAGNSLDKARRIFERTTKQRPRVRLTIRQRIRVLDEWPGRGTKPFFDLARQIAVRFLAGAFSVARPC